MHTRFAAARRFCALAVPLLMLGLGAGAGPAAASAPACQGWAGIPPLNPGTTANVLNGVAVISACDVWAVGSFNSFGPGQTLIEHWNGSAWTVLPSPDPGPSDGYNILTSVQAASPTDIWAVGYDGASDSGQQTLIVHWNGTRWLQVPSPSPGELASTLYGVRVVSRNDAWAVGSFGFNFARAGHTHHGPPPDQTLILHWNGTSWQQVASPGIDGDSLRAVSALSRRDAWAVGTNGTAVIEHWNGTRWTQVTSPSPGANSALTGVAAMSPANAWAVGRFYNGTADQTLIEHWNGHRWTRVPSPDPGGPTHDNTLTAVTVTTGSAWAVGSYTTGTVTKTLILHWNGTAWKQVTSPNPGTGNQLTTVRALTAGNAWAVGSYTSGTTGQALAIHCC